MSQLKPRIFWGSSSLFVEPREAPKHVFYVCSALPKVNKHPPRRGQHGAPKEPTPGPKPTTDDMRKNSCFNAPPALLRLSGGPTATLSRFPWSGGPTVNLSRFPSLGWSCGISLVLSGVLVVPRQLSRVFRGLVVLRSISRVFRTSAGPVFNLSSFHGLMGLR